MDSTSSRRGEERRLSKIVGGSQMDFRRAHGHCILGLLFSCQLIIKTSVELGQVFDLLASRDG
jgi:hypothetical protein